MSQCRYCKGTGKISLFTTIVDCDCVTDTYSNVGNPRERQRDSRWKNAWFSKKSKSTHGSVFYLNEKGDEIEITEISSRATPCAVHNDLQFVGIVDGNTVIRGGRKTLRG